MNKLIAAPGLCAKVAERDFQVNIEIRAQETAMKNHENKISLEMLERRDWHLWLLAILLIVVLSIGVLSLMFPAVFWLGNEMEMKAPKLFFGGFSALLALTVVYLDRKSVV